MEKGTHRFEAKTLTGINNFTSTSIARDKDGNLIPYPERKPQEEETVVKMPDGTRAKLTALD